MQRRPHAFRHGAELRLNLVKLFFLTLECVLGAVYLANRTVAWQQAGFGIVVAALITVAYIFCYPRKPRVIQTAGQSPTGPAQSP